MNTDHTWNFNLIKLLTWNSDIKTKREHFLHKVGKAASPILAHFVPYNGEFRYFKFN